MGVDCGIAKSRDDMLCDKWYVLGFHILKAGGTWEVSNTQPIDGRRENISYSLDVRNVQIFKMTPMQEGSESVNQTSTPPVSLDIVWQVSAKDENATSTSSEVWTRKIYDPGQHYGYEYGAKESI